MSLYDDGMIYMPLSDAQEFFVSEEGVSAVELMIERPEEFCDVTGRFLEQP